MATIAAVTTKKGGYDSPGVISVLWETLTTTNNAGTWYELPEWVTSVCIQATGTFGATLTMQGSNDGTNAFTLTEPVAGGAVTFAAAGAKQVLECPLMIRPSVGAVTDVDVIMVLRP